MSEVLLDLPRKTRGPFKYVVQPLTRSQRWRWRVYRPLADGLRRALMWDIPPFPCECDGVHPHEDWP